LQTQGLILQGGETSETENIKCLYLHYCSCGLFSFGGAKQRESTSRSFVWNEQGSVIVAEQNGLVTFIVWTKGLEKEQEYTISLVDKNGKGVIFGKGNAQVNLGTLKSETTIESTPFGELLLISNHPKRVVSNAEDLKIRIGSKDDTEQIMITQTFEID
jgi:hypothetical protein